MSFKEWLDDYYPYRNRNYKQEILYAKSKYDDTYLEYELLEMYKDTKQLHFFNGGYSNPIYNNLKKWFEQFKKK